MRFTLFFTLLFTIGLSGQNPDWRAITNMNTVKACTVIGGRIWAATEGGVYAYTINDGETSRFTTVNGLRNVNITALAPAPDGGVLTGSVNGYVQHITEDGTVQEIYQFEDSQVYALFTDSSDIWIGVGKGLAVMRHDGNSYRFFDYFINYPVQINEVRDIILFSGRIYIATDNGLLSAPSDYTTYTLNDPAQWERLGSVDGLPSASVNRLAVFNDLLWIGTEKGIATLSSSNILTSLSGYDGRSVTAFASSADTLYIASKSALYKAVAANPKYASHTYGNPILSLHFNAGVLWLGMQTEGLQNAGGNMRIILDGVYYNAIRTIVRDTRQNTWALAQKYKFFRPNNGFLSNINGIWSYIYFTGDNTHDEWSRLNSTVAAYADRFGNVWLGSWGGGLMVYRPNGTFVFFHNDEGGGTMYKRTVSTVDTQHVDTPPDAYRGYFSGANNSIENYEVITAFTEDAYGRLWIANAYAQNGNYLAAAPYDENNGFVITDQQQWRYFGRNDGISLPDDKGIPAIAADDFGRIWIATHDQGLVIFDYNNTLDDRSDDIAFKRSIDDNLAGVEVRSIAVDKDGIVWIGTTAGLSSFDGLNFYRHPGDGISGADGPIGNEITRIVVDDYNNKWVCTSAGLSILRDGRSVFEPGSWVSFTTKNSGLLDDNVHDAAVDPVTGEAWIATESGISVYSGSFAEIRPDFKQVSAGPNPFIADGGTRQFVIRRLKSNSTVQILSINGKLIRELRAGSEDIEGGRALWDGRDSRGRTVSSGVYFFHAYTIDGSATTGKIALIKP